MRNQFKKYGILLACIIMIGILASCCACAPHMMAHGCPLCHEECSMCRTFALENEYAFLAIALLFCAAILSACLHAFSHTKLCSIFPATLVARSVQMND